MSKLNVRQNTGLNIPNTYSQERNMERSDNFYCQPFFDLLSQGDFICTHLVTGKDYDVVINICSPIWHLKCDKYRHVNFLKRKKH